MFPIKALALAAACWLGAGGPAAMATDARKPVAQPFWVEELAGGLNAPWSMAWLPNGDMLIVEKFGGLRVLRGGKLDPKPVTGVPAAYKASTDGLLEIAVDPDFARNQRVFITFTEGSAALGRSAVFRARYTGDALVDGKVIFRATPESAAPPHPSVSRIVFLPDKTMLLASGVDDTRRYLAQRMDSHLGKILRLDRDGHAPKDNPFIGKAGVLPEIYAYGNRSPIGLYRDPRDGQVWDTENGPRGGDELNRIKPGGDYGWPKYTYGREYSGEVITDTPEAPGVEGPVVYWVPSISPSGLTFVTSGRYPGWRGDAFIGSLSARHLRRVSFQDGKPVSQELLLQDLGERIRDVRQGPDGYLYILTDNANGRLLRLRAGSPTAAQAGHEAHRLQVASNPTIDTFAMPSRPGDPAKGGQLFAERCGACHSVEPAAPAGIGPNLTGVFGRMAAATAHPYSPALSASGVKWGQATLDRFLAGPQAFVVGTTMGSAPVDAPLDRSDIIAFLKAARPAPTP